MTEERMIRVPDHPEFNLKFAGALIYYSRTGNVLPKDEMVETIAYRDLLELAPPKDWKSLLPNKEMILTLYTDAKGVARSTHSHTDLHAYAVVEIKLLRKLYPWVEEAYRDAHKSPYGSCGGNGEGLI